MKLQDYYKILTTDGWANEGNEWIFKKGQYKCYIGHEKGHDDKCIACFSNKSIVQNFPNVSTELELINILKSINEPNT